MTLLLMRLITGFLLLPYHFAVQATPVTDMSEADMVINVEKGFVLQRIGTYSHRINECILHTIVSLNNLCQSLPGNEVCLRSSSSIENSIELGTILSPNDNHWSLSQHEKENTSQTIKKEINSLLSNHKPGQFVSNIRTNFHFFNGDFYVYTPNDQLNDNTLNLADQQKERSASNERNTLLTVLEQLRNHRIGFNFLNNEEIRVVLSPIMQSIEKSYRTANVEKLMADFIPLIVSQTVNAFRSCSINQNDPLSPSCLIISTLFTIPSCSLADKYIIYNLHPIPIVMHGYQYIFSNLPEIFAYNENDQNVIVFDEYLQSKCILSNIVQCSIEPIPVSLSQMPCLNHMFSIESSQANDCEVTRSASSKFPILHIAKDIWIFNNQNADERCTMQPHETTDKTFPNTEAAVLQHVTCGKSIKCSDHRRLSSHCMNATIILMDKENGFYKLQPNFHISLNSLTKTVVGKYKTDMISLLQEIKEFVDKNATLITRLYRNSVNLIICVITLFLLTIISVCAKFIQKKTKQQLNIVERRLNNLSDIFLNNHNDV